MKSGRVPGVDKDVSRVVLGTMIIDASKQAQSDALLDAAFANGINAFDSAQVYAGGQSEKGLGDWLRRRGLRDRVVLLTKGCHPAGGRQRVTPADLKADLEASLARLRVDSIDLYVLHRDDPAVPVGPLVEAFNAHQRQGLIKAFGASNWRHDRIQQANDYAAQHGLIPFVASSPNYGLADQVQDPWGPGCVTLSGPGNADARAWYARNGMAVFAYSSLGRGLFSGRITRENCRKTADGACQKAYCHEVNFKRLDRAHELAAKKGCSVAQLALAFVLSQPLNVFALVGAASAEECAAATAATDLRLTPEELQWLDTGP